VIKLDKPRKSTTRKGVQRFRLDDVFHREDGPAIEHPNGYREWWQKGQLHRDDGPAVESHLGRKEWWIHGKCVKVEWPKDIDQKWLLLDIED